MKNSWNKVVAMILAAALCVSCGVTGFAEDTQTDENTEIVEVVEQQTQEEPPKEEAPEPVKEPEPAPKEEPKAEPAPEAPKAEEPKTEPAPEAPKAEEPKAEPAPAPETEEPKAEPAPEAPKAEEPKAEPAPAPVTEEPKAEPAPEEPKAEEPKADEPKKAEETKAEEPKAEEPKAEESQTEEPKPEEKPVEQPAVPVTKVEQPAEEAPAADEVKKENITVHIEWEDEDNALGLRPQILAVTLSGSDGQTYSAKIAEKDGWQHTFADLTTRRGAEVIYYSVDADDVTDYDKDVRGLTVTYTCTAQPVVDEQPAAEDENLIDDQMDGDPAELPDGDGPTVTETEDGTVFDPSTTYSTDAAYVKTVNRTGIRDKKLAQLAVDMRKTEPGDVLSYCQKWVAFQERWTEVLPAIPVYSNVYFDFYTTRLQNYRVTENQTWTQAIVGATLTQTAE